MASETATIDQFDTNNRLMELSPKGTKLQMEQSIDTLQQHTGVENNGSPRTNFNDDNISENNRKNVTISQREAAVAVAAADDETKKYECPNSVIFQFQTRPKRVLQSFSLQQQQNSDDQEQENERSQQSNNRQQDEDE